MGAEDIPKSLSTIAKMGSATSQTQPHHRNLLSVPRRDEPVVGAFFYYHFAPASSYPSDEDSPFGEHRLRISSGETVEDLLYLPAIDPGVCMYDITAKVGDSAPGWRRR